LFLNRRRSQLISIFFVGQVGRKNSNAEENFGIFVKIELLMAIIKMLQTF